MRNIAPAGCIPIKFIYHISDIQIRLLKRHTEYREVFDRLYRSLREGICDDGAGLIILTGDIVHAKTELSPELVDMTQCFFDKLADIAPVILIAGNHDGNLNNEHRMDSLQPLVKTLNDRDRAHYLYYVRNSEGFLWDDIAFSVMGIFDKKDKYIQASALPVSKKKIALFHGTVSQAVSDLGHKFFDSDLDLSFFDGFDMVLLGDIHRTQILQQYSLNTDGSDNLTRKVPTVAYAGSLIQQNHGESLNHGYLKWNIDTCVPTYIEVQNDYGYYTIDIKNGNLSDISSMPAKPRMRVRVENTDMTDVKRILTDIRKRVQVQELTINRIDKPKSGFAQTGSHLTIGDLRSVDLQNKLIMEFLEKDEPLDPIMIDRIKAINAELNSRLPVADLHTNVVWKLNRLEWSNMFSYGENNYIDFSKMKGAVGIFANNTAGKSSILDALSFCIFDKSSRAFKASEIINTRKEDFRCKVNFEIAETQLFIDRNASKRKYSDATKVDVDFWYEDEFNQRHSLNGEARRNTDDLIRSYVGTYDDYILTALSAQNSAGNGFVDKGQSDRKDLLSRFLGLTIFEDLYQLASTEISEVQVLLKQYQQQDFTVTLAQAELDVMTEKHNYQDVSKERGTYIAQRDAMDNEIIEFAKGIFPIDSAVVDIDTLYDSEIDLMRQLDDITADLTKLNECTNLNKVEYIKIGTALLNYNEDEIVMQYNDLCKTKDESRQLQIQLDMLEANIGYKIEKLRKLEKHKYDPNCVFCINNVFVKDAIHTKEELKVDKVLVENLGAKQRELLQKITNLEKYQILHTEWNTNLTKRKNIELRQFQTVAKTSDKLGQKTIVNSDLMHIRDKIKQYNNLKDAIECNKKIELKLSKLRKDHTAITALIDKVDNRMRTIHGKILLAKETAKTITEMMTQAKTLEDQYSAYEYYLKSVMRDGVPYELISHVIPELEIEVNNILGQMVDFTLVWQLDGKNVNVFIAYDENRTWPLDLTSGMERFISNIAIRTALLNISSLPRPNYLAIDEGFTALDADNMNSVYLLIEYLRSKFDFILIITHLDTLKDVVDSALEVKKDADGFSVVQYD